MNKKIKPEIWKLNFFSYLCPLNQKIKSIAMKTRVAILAAMFLMAGVVASCEEKLEDNSSQKVYYVVGYDGTRAVDSLGRAKSGGYLFISENLKDSLLTNNWNGRNNIDPLDGIIAFPAESMPPANCGFTFLPEEYRFAFKVQINSYRPMTEEELHYVSRYTDTFCYNPFNLLGNGFRFKYVVITSISKIQ